MSDSAVEGVFKAVTCFDHASRPDLPSGAAYRRVGLHAGQSAALEICLFSKPFGWK